MRTVSAVAERRLGFGPVDDPLTPDAGSVVSIVGGWKKGKAALGASFVESGLDAGETVVCVNPMGKQPCPARLLGDHLEEALDRDRLVTLEGIDFSGPDSLRDAVDRVTDAVASESVGRCLIFSWTDLHIGFDEDEMAAANRLATRLVRMLRRERVTSMISLEPVASMDLPVARALSDSLLFVERRNGVGEVSLDGSDETWSFSVENGAASFASPDEGCVESVRSSKVRRVVLRYLADIYPESAYQSEVGRRTGLRGSSVTGALKGIAGRYAESESLEAMGLVEMSGRVGRRIYYRATAEGLEVAERVDDA